jgi:hypothetical protein
MATTVKGKDLIIKVNGVAILCANSVTFNSSYELVEAACRESGGNADFEPGETNATLEVGGFVKIDNPVDPDQMRAYDLARLHKDKVRVQWVFGSEGLGGDQEFFGEALVPNISIDAQQKDNGSYTTTFQVVGEWDIRNVVAG